MFSQFPDEQNHIVSLWSLQKRKIFIFILSADHSEKQECSNIVASIPSGWKMGLLNTHLYFVHGIVAFSPVYQLPGLFLKFTPSSLVLHHVGVS